MPRDFSRIGVVGLGTMGAGIAEVFAGRGLSVVGVEQAEDLLARGRQHVEQSTGRAVKRGKLSEPDQQALLGRITFSTTLDELKDCDLVVEAVVERLDVKQDIFRSLDGIVGPEAVLATNTSSLSVTAIAAATSDPSRVVGMHFFNPAPVQRLVEVVGTVVADPAVVDGVRDLATRLGKQPVVVGDRAGFIANALLFGYLNSAMTMYESGHASREDIDAAMQLGWGYPMGPLALLDLIGLDTAYHILQTMHRETGDRRHVPAPILGQLVTAGLLGRKTGRGFYTYQPADPPDSTSPDRLRRDIAGVGVVGTTPLAGEIAAAFQDGGYAVRQLPVDALEGVLDADLAIEAVDDDFDTKREALGRLGAICKDGAILATTTAAVPVAACAAATQRPADVVGMHFLRPASDTPVVEVVSTVATAADVAETARALCRSIGRHPVSCGDRAGFLADALVYPYLNDAVRMLEAGYASADDIDTAMREGCRLPSGPFEVIDAIGADVVASGLRAMHADFPDPGTAPAPLLEQLVSLGWLGAGTGRGFREHPETR